MNVYGGDPSLLPGVEIWINAFIRDRVLRPYVLPERLVIPLPGAPVRLRRASPHSANMSCGLRLTQSIRWMPVYACNLYNMTSITRKGGHGFKAGARVPRYPAATVPSTLHCMQVVLR